MIIDYGNIHFEKHKNTPTYYLLAIIIICSTVLTWGFDLTYYLTSEQIKLAPFWTIQHSTYYPPLVASNAQREKMINKFWL